MSVIPPGGVFSKKNFLYIAVSAVAVIGCVSHAYLFAISFFANTPLALAASQTVSSSAQLTSALNQAGPGDVITLQNGSYSGFTASRSGSAGNPIIVQAANIGGAKITGIVRITGDYVHVIGLDMGSNTIVVVGSNNRVSRNYFKNSQGSGIYLEKGSTRAEVDHNELEGGAGHNGSETADAIMARPVCDIEENHYVHHNYLHSVSGDVNADAISSGYGNTCDGESVFEYNLIEDWGSGKYCIYEKGGGNIWRHNTCIGANMTNRGTHTSRNGLTRSTWSANWIEGNLLVFGGENQILGNRANTIHLGCGTTDIGEFYQQGASPWYYAATRNLVAGNTGKLSIGTIYSNPCTRRSAKDNRIEAHDGTIERGFETGTIINPTTNASIPQVFKLSPNQVGINAGTAPKTVEAMKKHTPASGAGSIGVEAGSGTTGGGTAGGGTSGGGGTVGGGIIQSPQTLCHIIGPNSSPPAGYGAPYNIFSANRNMLIEGWCRDAEVEVLVGDERQDTYIYNVSYYWNGTEWVATTLTGTNPVGSWFTGTAETRFNSLGSRMWYVAFTCHQTDGSWKCGCSNQACRESRWQVQGFVTQFAYVPQPAPSTGSSGGVAVGGGTQQGEGGALIPGVPNILLDTDITGDVDDVGALAMLHALADNREVNILGVSVSTAYDYAPGAVDAINTYFGRPNIPVGYLAGSAFANEGGVYAGPLATRFPNTTIRKSNAVPAVQMYRQILAAQPDNSVTIVTIGFLGNIENLLKSGADQYSSLSGRELVERKVKEVVMMGGQYPAGKEYNLSRTGDAASAAYYAIRNLPVPVTFSVFEIGAAINTGSSLGQLSAFSPVRCGYNLHKGGFRDNQSWDQTAVLYAVRGTGDYWNIRRDVTMNIQPDGSNSWNEGQDSDHAYLIQRMSPQALEQVIEGLMLQEPSRPIRATSQPVCTGGIDGSASGANAPTTGTGHQGGGAGGGTDSPAPGANLVWSDEFNSLSLASPSNPSGLWRPNDHWQRLDLPGYVDFAGTSFNINPAHPPFAGHSPFSVQNGVLSIAVRRTPQAIRESVRQVAGHVPVWSGGILILNPDVRRVRFGYIEFRARFPVQGAGMFPAIWFYSSDTTTPQKGAAEIDLLEIFGRPNTWNATLHLKDRPEQSRQVNVGRWTEDTQGWHTYGLDWQPGYLRFYRDGVLKHEITGTNASWFDVDLGIRMNYAADINASWFQQSDSSTPNEMMMEMDYVRVYSQKPQ